jgi:chemotaxis protein methyltransferase CheR
MPTNEDIIRFHETVKKVSEYDFSEYSEKSFARRIEKILVDYLLNMEELLEKIAEDRKFLEQIVKDITVNTTELFRDPKVWQTLKHRILPKLKENEFVNIWHAGCSTGQEVYSMLILLNELDMLHKARLYASDINEDVMDKAKAGEYVYRFNIEYIENFKQVIQVNPFNFEEYNSTAFTKYFDVNKINDTMEIKPFLKNIVTFKKHDLVKDNNIFNVKFDIILCRNVLIYFNSNLQNRVFSLFSEALERKGTLILGAHESILGHESANFIKYGHYYIKK